MLQSLKLKNFQAHRSLEIDLHPEVTSIVGPSDVGKSSVIRALRWLCTNKPQGNAFVRNGSAEASITLDIDGITIKRRRGNGINSYSINSYSINGKKFAAFRDGVPDEIAAILNLSDVSWQLQHDAPFWFAKTSGEVSKELNRIVNLDLIDKTLANLGATVRKAEAEMGLTKERLETACSKRNALAWTEEADLELKSVEEQYTEVQKTAEKALELSQIVEKGQILASTLQNAADASLDAGNVCLIGERIAKSGVSNRLERLERLVGEIVEAEEQSCLLQNRTLAAEKELRRAIGNTCPVCNRPMPAKVPS